MVDLLKEHFLSSGSFLVDFICGITLFTDEFCLGLETTSYLLIGLTLLRFSRHLIIWLLFEYRLDFCLGTTFSNITASLKEISMLKIATMMISLMSECAYLMSENRVELMCS